MRSLFEGHQRFSLSAPRQANPCTQSTVRRDEIGATHVGDLQVLRFQDLDDTGTGKTFYLDPGPSVPGPGGRQTEFPTIPSAGRLDNDPTLCPWQSNPIIMGRAQSGSMSADI